MLLPPPPPPLTVLLAHLQDPSPNPIRALLPLLWMRPPVVVVHAFITTLEFGRHVDDNDDSAFAEPNTLETAEWFLHSGAKIMMTAAALQLTVGSW